MKLYETLADDIERQIRGGVFRHGDRLQSVRETSKQRQLSITTVLRAYVLLESRGLILSKPQSGYYVQLKPGDPDVDAPSTPRPIAVSSSVDVSRLVLSTLRSIATHDAVPLGSPYPDTGSFPFEKLNRYAFAAGQDPSLRTLKDALPPGHPLLIRQIERDGYEAHLRRLRKAFAQQASLMRAIVLRFFPAGTRVSTPAGGYVLWVEMPPAIDGLRLYELALERGITIGPGYMFSVSNSYSNFIRLNYSTPWSQDIEQAVITVGKLAATCARQAC